MLVNKLNKTISLGDLRKNVVFIEGVQIRHVCGEINAKPYSFEYKVPHYINV